MLRNNSHQAGFDIRHIATCDFSKLIKKSNADILNSANRQDDTEKLNHFITEKMGITSRYHCPDSMNALDLARSALQRLIEQNPAITSQAEFFILAGISNPMPVSTLSAVLAGEFGFKRVSCWDIKSGCSTGVLGLIQAIQWFNMGAQSGVIVCSETLSKFTNPENLQMSTAIGDGAAAAYLVRSGDWCIRSIEHGSDPRYVNNMLVPGSFPINTKNYHHENYWFTLDQKTETLKALENYWVKSLQELMASAKIPAHRIRHYIAHQIDATKNAKVAQACGITEQAVAKNLRNFGNMGSPTVFINYYHWINRKAHQFDSGDILIWHAVGGGISWAGVCLEKL